jgi:outer membrane protein OmpA-like peptidoglycan-associated protein
VSPATPIVSAPAAVVATSPAARAPAPAPIATAAPGESAAVVEARLRALMTTRRGIPADEIGYYLDVFAARLRQMQIADVTVERREQRLSVDLTSPTLFDAGTAILTASARRTLATLSALLKEYDQLLISVHARTDSGGGAATDRRLTEQRALAVAVQFTAGGVAAGRLVAIGYGGSAVPNAMGEAAGSRVVLWLDPLRR